MALAGVVIGLDCSLPRQWSIASQAAAQEALSVDATPAESDEPESLTKPFSEEEKRTVLDDFVTPEQLAAKAFEPPPEAKRISKKNMWVDRKTSRVYCDGYVVMRDGPLEMFACGAGTKEHESVVAVLAAANEVHAALLAVGAQQGKPVQVLPEYKPATGQRIRVWVTYFDEDEKFRCVDARTWIRKDDDAAMQIDWVFGGSQVWTDPADGVKHYSANSGDMICVSNFTTAMMDVPIESSADAGQLMYTPFTSNIPERATPVRLVLQPIEDGKPEPVAPDEKVLVRSKTKPD
jgi:hypothetical protein